jgi:hypothetical protein
MSLSVSAKIPFQPGLALGSVVKGDVIEKLEQYNEVVSQMEKQQREMQNLEQGLKALKEKLDSIRGDTSPDQALKKLFGIQVKSIERAIENIVEEINKVKEVSIPFFSNITTTLESPIDFDTSKESIANRGFDSISFSSQYIDMNESSQRIQEKMEQSSSANSVSAGASFCGFSIGGSYSWSSGVMKRVAEIRNQGHASKILIINAMATTRHVRYFKNRKYDPIKLRTILNVMEKSSDSNELEKKGINISRDGEKSIYLLTEAVMGGSFSAIVTYLKDDNSQRDVNAKADHSSSSIGGKLSAPVFSVGGTSVKGKGGIGHSSQYANETHLDELQNQAQLNVSIEYISQGIIPQFARENIIREVYKYKNQDLQKYESSGAFQKGKSVESRQKELQEFTYNALNQVRSTEVEKDALSIHGVTSVTKAYDDFCGEIISDINSGIPVGFNYTILTQSEIKKEVSSNQTVLQEDIKKEVNQ